MVNRHLLCFTKPGHAASEGLRGALSMGRNVLAHIQNADDLDVRGIQIVRILDVRQDTWTLLKASRSPSEAA